MERPATLIAQLNKPCISWLPNQKSTSCQNFPDSSQLLQDSSHASRACLCTVHFPPAGHTAVPWGGCHGYNTSSWSPCQNKTDCLSSAPKQPLLELLLGVVILIQASMTHLLRLTPLAEVPLFPPLSCTSMMRIIKLPHPQSPSH